MKLVREILCIAFMAALLTGCSTTGRFKTPAGTVLYIDDAPTASEISFNGEVTRRPFFWTAVRGIKYRLEKDDSVIQEGRLPSNFRIASIFWPPYALLYWPLGFSEFTYDLTSAPTPTLSNKLDELKKLRDKGDLSEEEYLKARQKTLDGVK